MLTPIQTTYSIGAEGGSVSISFKTNLEYKVSSDAAWLTVPASTKAVETKTVTVTAAANTSTEQRSGNITIKGGDLTATVTVKQAGAQKKDDGKDDGKEEEKEKDVLENGGNSTYTVDAEGETIEVIVRSNVEYSVEVSADWISRDVTRAVTEDRLKFTVAANEKEEARSAAITVSYEEMSFTVTVNQEAYAPATEDPYLEISPESFIADAAGDTLNINVSANNKFKFSCPDNWVTVTLDGEIATVAVEANTSTDSRSATINFTSMGINKNCNITQKAAKSDEDPFDVGSDLSVNGTANCYVVTKAGTYTFDASVMGNGKDGFIWSDEDALNQHLWPESKDDVDFNCKATYYNDNNSPVKCEVLWQDGDIFELNDNGNYDVTFSKSGKRVSFRTNGNKGNAVIAVLTKDSRILWSWHIWCTDSPAQQRYSTASGTDLTLLDRNLGATSANAADGEATYGFWYQFGRKDPLKLYYNVKNSMREPEVDMQHSVEHPSVIYRHSNKTAEWFNNSAETVTADLWGNPFALKNGSEHQYTATVYELHKTIYDPCPPGYMVPPEWTWTGLGMDYCTESEYGLTFEVENGSAFYPFAGYGDAGDVYGGDNGWYGYPGFTLTEANRDSNGYHHNEMTVVAVWSSATTVETAWANFIRASIFYFHRMSENNFVKVDMSMTPKLYNIPDGDAQLFGNIRSRCCSVRCMKILN